LQHVVAPVLGSVTRGLGFGVFSRDPAEAQHVAVERLNRSAVRSVPAA